MKRLSFVCAVILLVVVGVASSFIGGSNSIRPGPPASYEGIDWYPVEEWEFDLCRKWGGPEKVEDAVYDSFLVDQKPVSVSVQATRKTLPTGQHLYEVMFYVDPVGSRMPFSLSMKNPFQGEHRDIMRNGLAVPGGFADFQTFTDSRLFTTAVFLVNRSQYKLEVPIVEQDYS